jgi:hypothetical protein
MASYLIYVLKRLYSFCSFHEICKDTASVSCGHNNVQQTIIPFNFGGSCSESVNTKSPTEMSSERKLIKPRFCTEHTSSSTNLLLQMFYSGQLRVAHTLCNRETHFTCVWAYENQVLIWSQILFTACSYRRAYNVPNAVIIREEIINCRLYLLFMRSTFKGSQCSLLTKSDNLFSFTRSEVQISGYRPIILTEVLRDFS